MKKRSESTRPNIGDVIEIDTPEGLAYAQFSHRDQQFGYLLRVLPGIYKQRPESFADLVNLEERFYVFFALDGALSRGIVKRASNEAVPDRARKFPLMRMAGWRDESGRVLNWWLYDGEREWQVDKLTPEQESLSLAQVWNDTLLVQRIIEGWSPRNSPSDQSADKEHSTNGVPSVADDRAVLYELQRAGSNLGLPHHIRHYLYFPTKTAASNAAETLRAEGYTVEVQRGADEISWLTLAEHEVAPTIEVVTDVRSRLEKLASSMQGEYDGWEAAITQ